MVLNYFSQHEDNSEARDHLKDSFPRILVLGYMVPIALLGVTIANLCAGRVFTPASRVSGDFADGLVQSYGWGWQFAGVVTGKVGIAFGFFVWYCLANYDRFDRLVRQAMLAAVVVVGAGVVMYAVGFFV